MGSLLHWLATYWASIIDIIIVYSLVYYTFRFLKKTQSFNVIRGVFFIGILFFISQTIEFKTLHWILDKFVSALLLVVIIIFQPELRRFLESLGRRELFSTISLESGAHGPVVIKQLLRAVEILSKNKLGALIVIEIGSNLEPIIQTGIRVNAMVSSDLITTLFWPNSPTHDGALILRQNKIEAVDCLLPLSESPIPDQRLGTRHKAAIGLSEQTDALVIVISEETGTISIAENGNLTRYLTKEALETRLFNLYTEPTPEKKHKQWLSKLIR